jgi:hypothetical protein
VPYASISSLPIECFRIRKVDFYEYIDDKTRKQFMNYIRRFPSDYDLRQAFYANWTWKIYKNKFIKENLPVPVMMAKDLRAMQATELKVAK